MSAPTTAPAAAVHVAAAAASSHGQGHAASPAAAAASASTPTVKMTLLHSYGQLIEIECHPTLPLVLIGTKDNKVVVFNWQTNATVGEVALRPDAERGRLIRSFCWLRPTADQPTVHQFVAILGGKLDQETFVCTVQDIHAAAAGGSKIESRQLYVSDTPTWRYGAAINSTNTLVCMEHGSRSLLVDLESGEEVLRLPGTMGAAQFAPDNPYTLFASGWQRNINPLTAHIIRNQYSIQFDLRSPACVEGRVSTDRPPKEWIISPADLQAHRRLLFEFDLNDAAFSRQFSPDARFIASGRKKGTPIVRSLADGRLLFEAPPAAPRARSEEWTFNYVFTSDGAYFLDWSSRRGRLRLISTANRSASDRVRWSIQLPNWQDDMHLEDVRPCPGQVDRLLCVVEHTRTSISAVGKRTRTYDYRLLDVQVLMPGPAVVQLPSRLLAPPAAAAAAASGPSSSSVGGGPLIPSVSPSASPPPSSALFPSAAPVLSSSTSPAPLLSALASDSTSSGADSASRVHQLNLRMEQAATRAALDQLAIAKQIIAEMQKELTKATAAPAAAAAAPLRPGQIVVKQEQLLDLHETVAVARRQKRKAEDETAKERKKRLQQATRHRADLELQLAERKSLMEARADQDKRIAQLDAKLENERVKTTCCSCLTDAVEVVYSPCGHAACCSDCDQSIRRTAGPGAKAACPICQQAITSRVRVTSLQHSDQGQANREPEDAADQDHLMPPMDQ